jgi:hypothetical protein
VSRTATVDVDAYLRRIGLEDATAALDSSAATLARLHRAHVAAIPYENRDPLRDVPVALELGALQDKLVTRLPVVANSVAERRTLLTEAGGALVLSELTATGARTQPVAPDQVGAVLAGRFGLDGWRWGPPGRPTPA